MPYIGKAPSSGEFIELDALTASATDTYTLQYNGADYKPETVNNLIVSINGVVQKPSSMSLNGSSLTVGATLSSSDTIDYIRVLGHVGSVITPTDGSVTSAKLDTNIAISGNLDVGTIRATNGTTAMTIDSSGRILTSARPAFMARRTSLQSAGVIIFDTALINIGSHYNTSTGVFTAPVAGLYSFSPVVLSDMDGSDQFFVTQLLVNGSSYAQEQVHTDLDNDFGTSFTVIASLSASDEVKVSTNYKIYGTSSATANFTFWSGYLIG